jgi:YidC/Oxa1 family membrane protein insertase
MQNRAVGRLYEDANQNPLAGCAVSLLQLPVFLGLYGGVRLLAMDGELQEPFLWIPSLEGPVSPPDYRGLDWLTTGWTTTGDSLLPTPALGWETTLAFLVMPVVLVLLQSATMNALQPPVDDNISEEEKEQVDTTQGVLKFLPLLIGFFSLQVPAGLTIYWFTSNIFTLTQSLAVRAYFAANPPDIELPEYWDALNKDVDEMSPEERKKAARAGIATGPSLQDMVDEARFHSLIARPAIRTKTGAWQRVLQARESAKSTILPPDLQEWVKAAGPAGQHSVEPAQEEESTPFFAQTEAAA